MGHTPNPNRSKLDHIDLSFRHNSHRKRISNQNQTRRIANTYSSFAKVLTTHNTTQPFDAKTPHVKKQMRKRVITLLFLPIAVFVWIIGWAMLWAGARNEQETEQTQAETRTEDESITIIPMIPEKFEEHEA
jgi:hypothetical protein